MMRLRPLYDRIIVKRVEQQRQTPSGIVIPDSAGEKPEEGEVIATGSGRLLQDGSVRPLQVQRGDRVLFGKYAGQTVRIEGEDYLVLKEEDVFGVFEATPPAALKKAA